MPVLRAYVRNVYFIDKFIIILARFNVKALQNLHTIAVVAATSDVPLTAFTCELYHALTANLRVLRLSSQKISELLDASVLEK